MNLKAFLVLVVVGLVLFCRFSDCSAQNSNFSYQSKSSNYQNRIQSELTPDFAKLDRFQDLANQDKSIVSLKTSSRYGGLELSLNFQDYSRSDNELDPVVTNIVSDSAHLRPQLTLFTSASYRVKSFASKYKQNNKPARFDRYKNTIPAVFRLTLKGYSIMEHSNNQTDTWTLNKVESKELRKPELMLSFTKRF